MEDRANSHRNSPVAVFPLPNTVFFPETVLPLHIFEPRYRQMVREAVAGSGLLAVTLLKSGWESDYYGNPPVEDIATVGAIRDLEPLPDGRFNLRLVGLQRVRLGRVVQERPYRSMEFEPIPELPGEHDLKEFESSKVELLATQSMVARELHGESRPGLILDPEIECAVWELRRKRP